MNDDEDVFFTKKYWGFLDDAKPEEGWFVMVEDDLGDHWAKFFLDLATFDGVSYCGSDEESIIFFIENSEEFEEWGRREKKIFEKSILQIRELTPEDFK